MSSLDSLRGLQSASEKIEFLKKVNWNLSVTESQTGWFVMNKNLCVSGRGSTLEEAFRKLRSSELSLFQDVVNMKCEDELRFPDLIVRNHQSFFERLKLSLATHICIGVFYLLIAGIAGQILKMSLVKGGRQIVKEWNAMTNTEVGAPKDRFERFQGQVDGLKPYVKELKRVWRETN